MLNEPTVPIAGRMPEITYTAEIIAHLARLSFASGNVCGLTNAQWTALRFFRRASRFSRTLTGFADYHATTRASASQTIKSLLAKGLVTRTLCEQDKRSARIALTEKGRISCDEDPFEELVRAVASLPKNRREHLTETLEHVLERVGGDHEQQSMGSCLKCRFLKQNFDRQTAGTAYFCSRAREDLTDSELHDICMKYSPKTSANLDVA